MVHVLTCLRDDSCVRVGSHARAALELRLRRAAEEDAVQVSMCARAFVPVILCAFTLTHPDPRFPSGAHQRTAAAPQVERQQGGHGAHDICVRRHRPARIDLISQQKRRFARPRFTHVFPQLHQFHSHHPHTLNSPHICPQLHELPALDRRGHGRLAGGGGQAARVRDSALAAALCLLHVIAHGGRQCGRSRVYGKRRKRHGETNGGHK